MKLVIFVVVLVTIACGEAAKKNINPEPKRVIDICELVTTMVAAGFNRADMEDWACLVKHESSYNSNAVGGPNSNGSYDYGIFQINDGFWCSSSGGGDCSVTCASLTDDDISNDISCARIIFNRHGFNAWYGWINNCQGAKDPVDHCFK